MEAINKRIDQNNASIKRLKEEYNALWAEQEKCPSKANSIILRSYEKMMRLLAEESEELKELL